uniref:F-actin monooxygenase n=1 Tax=Anopheles epiroticus TaxID=199890 RepID=A0A182P169_9DIPT
MSEEFILDHERAAMATEMFLHFCAATTMKQIRGLYWNMLDTIGLRPGPLNEFYPKMKAAIRDWRAQALFKKFDARAAHKVYCKGRAACKTRVLIVGAGPCGLRTAIDAQLLGAKVVVVEKRDRISRNNVLHLWPFIIHDLKALGAKKFYGKFCAGSIDHISIRQLQCILLKVALLLGVEMHEGVSFVKEIEPGDGYGWRASVSPEDHAVSHYEFDVLIGADGKRNTLEGFQRKEFRGKLAIAITANFINKRTEAEAMVEEISGVAFIFDQPFFKALYEKTGCDLENIVYYKDDTHYFVMTAKKHSLLHRGVIIKDLSDPAELLAPSNVDKPKLYEYARDAANFATKYQMPNLEFAVNHYGTPDVAVFDFTSIFAAHNSCKVTVRKNYRLLSCLVGDSLLEPFWPTGSGCARGFLSSMDAAYAIKLFANPKNSLLATIAQRESVYRLLGQTTPENLNRAFGAYTLDPSTRYKNLNKSSVQIGQVKHLLDTDDPVLLEQTFFDTNAIASTVSPATELPVKRKRRTVDVVPLGATLLRWLKAQLKDSGFVQELNEPAECFTNGKVLCTLIHRYRPDLVNLEELADFSAEVCNEHAFNIFENQLGIPRVMSGQESVTLAGVDPKVWLNYLEQICDVFRGEVPHVKHIKLDYAEFKQKQETNVDAWSKLGRMAAVQRMAAIASGVHPDGASNLGDAKDAIVPIATSSGPYGAARPNAKNYYHPNAEEERYKRGVGGVASPQNDTMRRMRKRRSNEKSVNIVSIESVRIFLISLCLSILGLTPPFARLLGYGRFQLPQDAYSRLGRISAEERTRRLQEIEANRQDRQSKRREQRAQQTQNFYKSIHMLQANTLLRESDGTGAFEDYSLYLYRQSAPVFTDRVRELELKLRYPDRERGLAAAYPRGLTDGADQFSDRVRSMEQRIDGKTVQVVEKKPKDLLRAIGKIDSSDWNVKEIERKIEQSKKTTDIGKSRERVPNWNREQFLARQNRLMQPQDDEKYREIDSSLKAIDKQLKEGHNLDLGERGKNKVALIAGQLQTAKQAKQEKQQQQLQQQQSAQQGPKSVSIMDNQKALVLTASGVAEKCHFCKQRVYLMEKISAEGLTLHRSCLKCHHCHTILRLGSYAFDRDDPEGRFYCTPHFKLPAKTLKPAARGKPQSKAGRPAAPVIGRVYDANDAGVAVRCGTLGGTVPTTVGEGGGASTVDYLSRNRTPDNDDSDGEPNMEVIDENEWTDRNFGTESEVSEADMSSSDESETDSESDYEETAGSPLGAQTLQLASEWISDKRFSNMVDSDADFYSYSSEDDDADSQTEGEELARAREMRRQEVKLMPPPTLPTDTETEAVGKSVPAVAAPVPTPPLAESAEDRAIKERMLQKLSVREQWLHAQQGPGPAQQPATAATGGGATDSAKVKSSTSFFGGLMNSLTTLIKPKSQISPPTAQQQTLPTRSSPSPLSSSLPVPIQPAKQQSPPAGSSASPKQATAVVPPSPLASVKSQSGGAGMPPPSPTPSHKKLHRRHSKAEEASASPHSKRAGSVASTASLKHRGATPPGKDTRDEADEFLQQLKQEQLEAEKRSKKQEAKKFKTNMQSIRSAVDGGPKVVGVKSEQDVAKFFAENQKAQAAGPRKPKALPNKDVAALQQSNSLARYFPAKAAAGGGGGGGGTTPSVSSAEGSPALSRKKRASEVDLLKYFGAKSSNASSPTPPSSVVSPVISRNSSIESPGPVRKASTGGGMSPKPPVVPLPPKKNILAFQPIRKSKTEAALMPAQVAKAAEPKKVETKAPAPRKVEVVPATKPVDPDEQLFEDLLQDVNDELIDTFDAIVEESRSNKSSPKETRKNKPAPARKESPKKAKKENVAKEPVVKTPAVPKMTIKRPAFKITMPVKMQETLEEIYLASLSKLDTRSSSLIDLTNHDAATETVEPTSNGVASIPLGKVLEEKEPVGDGEPRSSPVLGSLPSVTDANGPDVLTLQPFQAPPKTKQQIQPKATASPSGQTKAAAPAKATGRKEASPKPKATNAPSAAAKPAMTRKTGSPASSVASPGTPTAARKVISSVQISLSQPSTPAATLTNGREESPQKKRSTVVEPIKQSPKTAAPKSAFAAVSNDPLSQKSISMLELHRRVPAVSETNATSKEVLCNGLATPSAKRKQQPKVAKKPVEQQSKLLEEVEQKKEGNKPTKPVVEPPQPATEAVDVAKPLQTRCRTLSSDEQCFEELRKKHEAIFANQQNESIAPQETVPKTLSDVRNSLLVAPPQANPEAEDRIDPHYREGINQLVMELMPGVALDADEVPIPKQRQKSSFHKELQKLQRANTVAICGPSSPSTNSKPETNGTEFRMEVIRTPVAKVTPAGVAEKRQGSEEKMQIRLERSTQIKEQYVKKGSVLPSSLASATNTPNNGAGKKQTFVMPNVPSDIDRKRGILSRDKEVAGAASTKKSEEAVEQNLGILSRDTTIAVNPKKSEIKELERENVGALRGLQSRDKEVTGASAKKLEIKASDDVGRARGTASQDVPVVADSKKSEIDEFEDLLKKIEEEVSLNGDIDLDELLADEEPKEKLPTPVIAKKSPEKKPDLAVMSKPQAPAQPKVASSSSTLQESGKRTVAGEPSAVSKPTNNTSSNRISAAQLNETISQLTDKLSQSRQTIKPAAPRKDEDLSKDAFTSLFSATDPSQTDLDLFEELCKREQADAEPKQNRSDLVDSTSNSATIMPDVVSSTKKPEPKAMKILDCMESLKQVGGAGSKIPLVPPPQEIQVYTLHTAPQEEEKQPQPSTQGMSGDYAHILKDITSGLVGADFAAPVVYEPPSRDVAPRKDRSEFQAYKQLLEEKASREEPIPTTSSSVVLDPQPQRPLRRQKKIDRAEAPSTRRAPFDNSLCIDPWRARKSASIENIAIEQVFVKQNDSVVDTFFVVPDARQQRQSSKVRRSKSYDRLAVPGSGQRRGSLKQKQSLEELRDFGYDVEPSSRSRHLVDPRLRHIELDLGSDEELANLRDHPTRRWQQQQSASSKFRKNKSMTDVARAKDASRAVEPPKVDIDRESPRPRTTDFSKWEAILDRGVTYYEGGAKPKPDIKSLERRVEDLDIRRARPLRRKAIPKDYDPDEYVPRINRRGADLYDCPDPTLPRDYDPDEYIPKPTRAHAVPSPPDQPLPRSYDPEEYIPKANRRDAPCYEVPVAIQRAPAKYYKEPYYPVEELAPPPTTSHYGTVPLGRSKTAGHVPTTSSGMTQVPITSTAGRGGYERELPRDIARSQYARRYDAEDRHIVDRSHRLHEKTNKYIRTQLTRNDPNPYIREMLENDSDEEYVPHHHHPSVSGGYHAHHHQRPTALSSSMAYGTTGSSYGSSGAAAMSRIQTKAITQPSRMLQYGSRTASGGRSGAAGSSSSYDPRRRGGDNSRTRDNCNISECEFDPSKEEIEASYSRGASDSEVNSTEISTDSEFDDEQPQRVPPSFHLEFKPLVEVDPTIKLVQARAPLAVPRPGDYALSKTASTEGIASKKSLELKKKYLLGEGPTGLGVLKSGSASALDSKFKTFHSNITECQKLLNPAAQISPTMQTFLRAGGSGSITATAPTPVKVSGEVGGPAVAAPQPVKAEPANDTAEKENVYEGKRGVTVAPQLGANKRSSLVETINTTLVENKLNEIKSNESFPLPAKEEAGEQQGQDGSPVVAKPKQPDSESVMGNGHLDPAAKLKNSLNNNNINGNGHTTTTTSNNNNNNNGEDVIEIIDLVTPEKKSKGGTSPEATRVDGGGAGNGTGGAAVPELKYLTAMKHAYIDLTTDSPNCDRSLVETTLDFSIAPSKVAPSKAALAAVEPPTNSSAAVRIDSNDNKIEQHATNGGGGDENNADEGDARQKGQDPKEQQQGEDGCHETTLQVPDVPWTKGKELESDSISESGSNSSGVSRSSGSSGSSSSSSSSTSSVEDIPHFILDSTTSPETQNDERFVPRLEVRDATGELMQIDSLMIIDGRYIGDPEDLKLMEKLPPDTQIAAQMLQAEINLDSINTVVEEEGESEGKGKDEDEGAATPTTTPPAPRQAEDEKPPSPTTPNGTASLSNFVSQRNACFRFDSRNEHKLDTLKNLPFVLDAEQRSTLQQSMRLPLAPHAVATSETDAERTPMAGEVPAPLKSSPTAHGNESDSPEDDTEVTTQNNLTETELSDWAADDAVSENFVDLEFALSTNRGTIRRNPKPKPKRPNAYNGSGTSGERAPAVGGTEDGIMRNLALDDIEFMDTGSEEESCLETYSTTNRMVLRSRGYVEIMDPAVESRRAVYPPPSAPVNQRQLVEAINSQVAGRPLDYIEQGAYLLATDDARTPMNEEPPGRITFSLLATGLQGVKLSEPTGGSQDVEEDSLLLVSTSQGTTAGTVTDTDTNGDVRTVVAPASRDHSPARKISVESLSGKRSSLERRDVRKDSLKSIEDIGYEKYVKRLQQKIQQISNARDSLEVKKSKRKSSKGETALPAGEGEDVIEGEKLQSATPLDGQPRPPEVPVLPEPPKTVEKKIEEITKERVKQKDLIHDLVMDKLQTKKQANAEKRLNRSRNRSNVLGGQCVPSHASSPSGVEPAMTTVTTVDSAVTPRGSVPMRPLAVNQSPAAAAAVPSTPIHQELVTPRATLPDGMQQPPTTEQLREEARSRARLKSNQDLGLSPEDRLLLLRKKYHITLRGLTDDDDADGREPNKSDDAKCKDQQQQQQQQHYQRTKLITSKSVNDVSMLKQQPTVQQSVHPASLTHQHPHHGQPGFLVTSTGAAPSPKPLTDYISDPNLVHSGANEQEVRLRARGKRKDRERRKSIIEKVSEFFNGRKKADGSKEASPTKDRPGTALLGVNGTAGGAPAEPTSSGGFLRFTKISPKLKDKSKTKESSPYGARCASDDCLNNSNGIPANGSPTAPAADAVPPHHHNSYTPIGRKEAEELEPPPIPPLPLNYERSDDEAAAGAANESKNELKKVRAMSKTSRQAELKRLRIAQEIQREQAEIDVKIKDLETRGVAIEKELRGESETLRKHPAGPHANLGANDDGLVKEWLEIMSSITRLKVRDEELSIRQQELQLEHRHAQLKEELNMRLSYGKLDKNSSDVAAEGAILNEMLEIVAKRQALRPSPDTKATAAAVAAVAAGAGLAKPGAGSFGIASAATARKPKDTDVSIARILPFQIFIHKPYRLFLACCLVVVLVIAVTLTR